MEHTPDRPSAIESAKFQIAEDNDAPAQPVRRMKKPPPITPRRFEKFFTPRPRNARHAVRTSRTALQDITGPALNRRKLQPRSEFDLPTINEQPAHKKRKLSFTSQVSSPIQSSPIKGPFLPSSSQEQPYRQSVLPRDTLEDELELKCDEIGEEDETDIEEEPTRLAKAPIRPYNMRSLSNSLLSSRISGRRSRKEADNSRLWQQHTSNFYSSSKDVYSSSDPVSGFMALPFSVTSCNTNSLVAIGNEDGNIQLVDSADGDRDGFSKTYLTMRPHENAIMDMEFSSDDALLATAAGDQTSQIIDMQTQTSVHCLTGHHSSIKRIQFQPGSGNKVLATCSRDGCINFWDLRCRTVDRPSFHLRSLGRTDGDDVTSVPYTSISNSIREAHAISTSKSRKSETRSRTNAVPGRNDFSVTSLSFLGPSRPNMLVTASEVDAVVKLWDMRTTYNSRRGRPVPVSCTRQPKSHDIHRPFGLTSLAISGDGSRLYTLCRDHTVYTYATSHLILGCAPQMSTQSSKPFRPSETVSHGLGPLYAFRHPQLRISTFYPRLAVRKSSINDAELLATGSSDDCAVLFPTDERYLTKLSRQPPTSSATSHSQDPSQAIRPGLTRTDSTLSAYATNTRDTDADLKIYYHGMPLIRGHRKEVTAVAWTSEGSLVTASDDFNSRCWRENAGMARDMRMGGEGEGRRWGAGWASVEEAYDEEE